MDSVVQWGENIDADRWSAAAAAAIADPCQALPEQVKSSSKGRPWRGLAVWHQVGPAGDLYIPRMSAHTILVRRASPTELVQRHGGTVQRRRWLPGEAIIVPSGVPTFWRSESPRDNIHIDLDPAWLQRVVGGGHAQLRSCFGQPDPVLSALAAGVELERFRAKWVPVRVKKTRQRKNSRTIVIPQRLQSRRARNPEPHAEH